MFLFQYYESDPTRLGSAAPTEPTDDDEEEEEYEVDAILKKRVKKGKTEYFVRWKYYNDTTWEPEENLQNVLQMIDEFEKKVKLILVLSPVSLVHIRTVIFFFYQLPDMTMTSTFTLLCLCFHI